MKLWRKLWGLCEKGKMKAKTIIFILMFVIMLFLLWDFWYNCTHENCNRERPTFPTLPQFVYIEHFLYALSIPFFVYLFLAILGYLIGKANFWNWFYFKVIFSAGFVIAAAYVYEIKEQRLKTLEQLPFEILGLIIFGLIMFCLKSKEKERKNKKRVNSMFGTLKGKMKSFTEKERKEMWR